MSPIKANLKTEALPLILLGVTLAVSFYFYANFPPQVATHWNYRGEVDGYSSKAFTAFFFPLLNVLIYALFLLLPYIDPKKDRYAEFAKPYHVFKDFLVAFLTLIYFYVGLYALGVKLPVTYVVPPAVGVLFIAIGNYLGKIKSNWFMGIRTPWTMSNEEVWNKTNRLGGKLFMVAGVFSIVGVILPPALFFTAFMIVIIFASLLPVVYSFLLYRKLNIKLTRIIL